MAEARKGRALVRRATAGDVAALGALFRAEAEFAQQLTAYYELAPTFDWEEFVRGLLRLGKVRVLVAELEDELVGFLFARIAGAPGVMRPRRSVLGRLFRPRSNKQPVRAFSRGIIESCLVEEGARRRGVGQALVDGALGWFRARGIRRVELGVFTRNSGGEAFWRTFGFVPFLSVMERREEESSSSARVTPQGS